mmetsp:Transcript_28749/g.32869  ORF Transcript_28749/g.32869 Transcript_28749/m.32869 type:complete len:88 (-) Transcript_28749:69-332(-)
MVGQLTAGKNVEDCSDFAAGSFMVNKVMRENNLQGEREKLKVKMTVFTNKQEVVRRSLSSSCQRLKNKLVSIKRANNKQTLPMTEMS